MCKTFLKWNFRTPKNLVRREGESKERNWGENDRCWLRPSFVAVVALVVVFPAACNLGFGHTNPSFCGVVVLFPREETSCRQFFAQVDGGRRSFAMLNKRISVGRISPLFTTAGATTTTHIVADQH